MFYEEWWCEDCGEHAGEAFGYRAIISGPPEVCRPEEYAADGEPPHECRECGSDNLRVEA